MKITIIGAGVAGSVLSDVLTEMGHEVLVIEKSKIAGGMCKSYYKGGFTYEYGPHILANHHSTNVAKNYILKKLDVVNTKLTSASFLKNKITYYPPSIHSAKKIGLFKKVQEEIKNLSSEPDMKNFETYLISKVGPTLYKNFFKNFTKKFWNIEPSKLSSEWALIRKLGASVHEKKMFFNNKWCSYPKKDWNQLFDNCLKNKRAIFDVEIKKIQMKNNLIITKKNEKIKYDFLISTLNIDQLHDFKFGKLGYAGYEIETKIIKKSDAYKLDNKEISMLYFPETKFKHCRITNYGSFQQKKDFPYNDKTILTIEKPNDKIRLYPRLDEKNIDLFNKYLIETAKTKNVISFGRLGLYKYLTSDTTIEMVFRLKKIINTWTKMSLKKRISAYKKVRGDWNN